MSKTTTKYSGKTHKEELDKVCAELSVTAKCKVTWNVLYSATDKDDEGIIVFFKTPSTDLKLRCMDLAATSVTGPGRVIFDATVLKESDPKVFVRDNDEDDYYLGALILCGHKIKYATAEQKKN